MPAAVRLTVPSDAHGRTLARATAAAFAQARGLGAGTAGTLDAVVDGLLGFVLPHAYPDDPTGEVELGLGLEPGAVRVTLHDRGRPLASFGGGLGDPPPGLAAVDAATEDLRLVNLGADGKRWSASIAAPGTEPDAPTARAFGDSAQPVGTTDPDTVAIRPAGPDDAEAVSGLLFTNYGLTYGHPDFYRPRWLADELADGRVVSSVAVHAGEVVGHHALLLDGVEAAGETGVAVVHPAYRGLGLFSRLFDHTIDTARARSLPAVYGRAVTVHPYSQRAERAHGYRETALLLGAVPAAMAMRGLADAPGRRTATLVTYRPLADAGPRPVTLPPRFEVVLRAAYARLGLTIGAPTAGDDRGAAQVTTDADDRRGTALIRVGAWGEDGTAALLREIHALTRRRDDVLYVDLDLHTLGAGALEEALTLLGERYFFLAGLMPFGPGGHDRLRLQRQQTEAVEIDGVVADSEDARALRDAVLADRARVGEG